VRRFQRPVITFTARRICEALLPWLGCRAAHRGEPVSPPQLTSSRWPPDIGALRAAFCVFVGPGHWHPNLEAVGWFCREVRPCSWSSPPQPVHADACLLGDGLADPTVSLQDQGAVVHAFPRASPRRSPLHAVKSRCAPAPGLPQKFAAG